VRVVHNVQQDEIEEEVGINLPRIYAAPDNKKDEFQSHLIKVEGMIDNQTIATLIDSGDSHNYVDPKMV
jgi:hypothetical protein